VLAPRFGRLPELFPELGRVGVLGLPADQPGPVGEEGLVDDLHPAGRLVLVLADLVGGEEPGVDELAKDLFGRGTAG
jgi:hypothetical protein